MTPVYAAASRGQVGALKSLISAGANFNTANVVSKNMSVLFVLYRIWNSNQGQSTEINKQFKLYCMAALLRQPHYQDSLMVACHLTCGTDGTMKLNQSSVSWIALA